MHQKKYTHIHTHTQTHTHTNIHTHTGKRQTDTEHANYIQSVTDPTDPDLANYI